MKIFIAGPRAITRLNQTIATRLNSIISENYTVLVGDANGVDKAIQKYLYEHNFKNVKVFASKGKARNNLGNWDVENVAVPDNIKGFEFYARKDYAMAENADYGFMIWNGKSRGTLNNMINLLNLGKNTVVYFAPEKKCYVIKSLNGLSEFVKKCPLETQKLFKELALKDEQIELIVH